MSFINPRTKNINLKLIYFGPVLSGKSTTLRSITRLLAKKEDDWAKVRQGQDRTAFFDFLALSLGKVRGQQIHVHLYAVPGPILYKANRRLLFKGIDGVIFVADSRVTRLEENLYCLQDLEENLRDQDIFYEELPVVFQ